MELIVREDINLRTKPGLYTKQEDTSFPGVSKFSRDQDLSDLDYSFDDRKFNFLMYIYNCEGYDTYIHQDKIFQPVIEDLLQKHGMLEEIKEQSSLIVGMNQDENALTLIFAPISTCEGEDIDNPIPMINTDYPFEIQMDDKEMTKFIKHVHSRFQLCPTKPAPETHVLFTRDRMSIFDIFAQVYTGEVSFSTEWTQEEVDFLSTLNAGELYENEYFNDKNFKPRRLVIMESTLEIPIFESIGGKWVFYKHNFDANSSSIKIKETE